MWHNMLPIKLNSSVYTRSIPCISKSLSTTLANVTIIFACTTTFGSAFQAPTISRAKKTRPALIVQGLPSELAL